MYCTKVTLFGRLRHDGLSRALVGGVLPYETVWVDETSSFVGSLRAVARLKI